MRYIKERNNFKSNVKTVLYLHGLDGHLNKYYQEVIESLGFQYIGLETDYRIDSIWKHISNLDVDYVVGHSMGGYLAYYLGNFNNIPCLMFMPCFDDEMFKIQQIPEDVLEMSTVTDNKLAVIGNFDEDIDKTLESKYLKDIETFKVNLDHDLTDAVFKKYCDLFFNKYIN